MALPIIGLTLDHEPPGGYSKFPWYAIRENYCNAVRRAGGLPILLPHDPEAAPAYLDQIDGLIVTGGGFDVDPALFGAVTRHPRNEPGHTVRVIAGTLLRRITGADSLGVNSAHHQAVKTAGPGLVIDAVAEDGVVEGIEDPRHRFCLGVQWHPEFEISEADRRIFRAFVEVAGG